MRSGKQATSQPVLGSSSRLTSRSIWAYGRSAWWAAQKTPAGRARGPPAPEGAAGRPSPRRRFPRRALGIGDVHRLHVGLRAHVEKHAAAEEPVERQLVDRLRALAGAAAAWHIE